MHDCATVSRCSVSSIASGGTNLQPETQMDELARRITALEARINELSERDDYRTNPEIVTLTEELDDLVIQYYRLRSGAE